jgi:hypothetical protein
MSKNNVYKISGIKEAVDEPGSKNLYERVNNIMKGKYYGETELIEKIIEVLEKEHAATIANLKAQLKSSIPETVMQ